MYEQIFYTMTKSNQKYDSWTKDASKTSLLRDNRNPIPVIFKAEPEAIEIDVTRVALLIIDMQNDFIDPNGWFGSVRGEDVGKLSNIIPNINSVSKAFRKFSVPIIHLNWGVRNDLANLPANVIGKASSCGEIPGYGDKISSGEVLVRGSWGANSVATINKGTDDLTVFKHRLSGFQDNELDQVLRRRDISTLVYAGINLDRCVFATLMDGCFQGYDAILVDDASTTTSPEYVRDAIIYLIRTNFGFTTKTSGIVRALSPKLYKGNFL